MVISTMFSYEKISPNRNMRDMRENEENSCTLQHLSEFLFAVCIDTLFVFHRAYFKVFLKQLSIWNFSLIINLE